MAKKLFDAFSEEFEKQMKNHPSYGAAFDTAKREFESKTGIESYNSFESFKSQRSKRRSKR